MNIAVEIKQRARELYVLSYFYNIFEVTRVKFGKYSYRFALVCIAAVEFIAAPKFLFTPLRKANSAIKRIIEESVRRESMERKIFCDVKKKNSLSP